MGQHLFYSSYETKKGKERRAKNRERYQRAERNGWLMRQYGIGVATYEKMLANQNGVCAICQLPPDGNNLSVGHDHVTKKNRGLVHSRCNFLIGLIESELGKIRTILNYLEKNK